MANPLADAVYERALEHFYGRSHAGELAERDIGAALRGFHTAASAGHAAAMRWLARCYRDGWGGVLDQAQYVAWILRGADAGDNYCLGVAWSKGLGGRAVDHERGYGYYLLAADDGDPFGMAGVGYCFGSGEGVPFDLAEARTWYARSAELGDPFGMSSLGLLMWYGLGTPVNSSSALAWFRRAAALDDGIGMFMLGVVYQDGRPGSGVARDDLAAMDWYQRAAAKNDASAMVQLADMYHEGTAVVRDDARALALWRRAAELGDVYGMRCVAWAYERGYGVDVSPGDALEWYERAARGGNERAVRAIQRLDRWPRICPSSPPALAPVPLTPTFVR